MFTKLEQRSWIKIEVARCRSTEECFQGLCEALCGTDPRDTPLLLPRTSCAAGNSEILKHQPYTRYKSMRLRSLRQSQSTTAGDPVQHNRWAYQCYRVVNAEHCERLTRLWCTTLMVINKGGAILKIHKWCIPVNKAMTKIFNCCHYFLSHHYSYPEVTRLC